MTREIPLTRGETHWNGTLADAIERLRTLARFIDEVCRTSRDGFARVMMHRDDTAAIARVLAALELHPPSPSERPPARPGAPTLGDASAASPSASPSAVAGEGISP